MSRDDQKLTAKEIGELVGNYFIWINKVVFLKEDKHN